MPSYRFSFCNLWTLEQSWVDHLFCRFMFTWPSSSMVIQYARISLAKSNVDVSSAGVLSDCRLAVWARTRAAGEKGKVYAEILMLHFVDILYRAGVCSSLQCEGEIRFCFLKLRCPPPQHLGDELDFSHWLTLLPASHRVN